MNTPKQPLPERFCYPSPSFSYSWNTLRGKAAIERFGLPPEEEVLAHGAGLMQGDPLADALAQESLTMDSELFRERVHTALTQGVNAVDEPSQVMRDLFEQVETRPEWLDEAQCALASRVIRRTGNLGSLVLRDFALMGGYQSSAINKPLVFTGALDKAAVNRIAETNSFWVDITRKNGLKPNSVGIKTAVRVRIMHAILRIRIQQNPSWDSQIWGLPINQLDMLATTLAFSTVFVDGVRRLGLLITDEEAEAIMHFWKYVGYLLGIDVARLPESEREAHRLLYCLTMSQPDADEDSKYLAQALMKEPLDAPYLRTRFSKSFFYRLHIGLNRYFLDDVTCEMLGIPDTRWKWVGPALFAAGRVSEAFRKCLPKGDAMAILFGSRRQDETKTMMLMEKDAEYRPVVKLKR